MSESVDVEHDESDQLDDVSEPHGADDASDEVAFELEVDGSEDLLDDGNDEGPEVQCNNDLEVLRYVD